MRVPMWIVDMGICKKVKIVFLVAEQIQNIGDRSFKDMKHRFHSYDIFCMTELLSLLGRGGHVLTIKVTNNDFKDWVQMLNDIYRQLLSSTTFNNHVFIYNIVSAGVIETKRVGYSPPEQYWLVMGRKKQKTLAQFDREQRRAVAQAAELQSLVKSSIKPIKQLEIFTRWLPLCKGKQGCNELCP